MKCVMNSFVVIFISNFIDRLFTNHKHSKVVFCLRIITIILNLISKVKIDTKYTFIFGIGGNAPSDDLAKNPTPQNIFSY